MLRGYRGFARELARTGTLRALWMQVRTGAAHVARRALGRDERTDPVATFLRNYEADGFRLPDATSSALALSAEPCLVCGLCSAACARAGGAPRIDPRDAVIAASRLAIDWVRLGLAPGAADPGVGDTAGAPCAACRACDDACPAGIPIHRIQEWLSQPRD